MDRLDSIQIDVSSKKNKTLNKSYKSKRFAPNTPIEPEPYSEEGLTREIEFTERELNGLLANNTDLAKKLAIDLSDDLVSAKLILPVMSFPSIAKSSSIMGSWPSTPITKGWDEVSLLSVAGHSTNLAKL